MFMQRTQRKDAVRNIFKRKISYLSILLTITLGVTGLLCIFFLAVSMEKVAAKHYESSNFRDIEITASLGLSAEDLEAIRAEYTRPIVIEVCGAEFLLNRRYGWYEGTVGILGGACKVSLYLDSNSKMKAKR